ncbi:non-homologous end-joining DNA ligase [Stappia sediminis]|uniref:non-homologous end-joining DNA ligase n=1 Tax=Stappia sediminis TaxID=2692190 RepID=UPI001AD8E1C3|nr:non-homologous end-joining DNA ligase [Stappia sediminis]
MTAKAYELDGHSVEVSNPDKVLFPEDGITKSGLADYYARIAKIALPHYRDRPLTMQRFPDGIAEDGFFQKHAPEYFPDWIDRAEIAKEDGTVRHVLAHSAAALVYLADQGCITPHLGVARADRPERPDRLVFDLDPPDDDFSRVQEVAGAIRDRLDAGKITSFVQTTGSRGLHIVVALRRTAGFDPLRRFMRGFAESVARALPDLATTQQRKAQRGDRVLIDTFRTAYGQTFVAPYAVRARPGAPVATPVEWDEALSADMSPRKYNLKTIFRRLGQTEDPWHDIDDHAVDARSLAG